MRLIKKRKDESVTLHFEEWARELESIEESLSSVPDVEES